jgi:hypothetical protein
VSSSPPTSLKLITPGVGGVPQGRCGDVPHKGTVSKKSTGRVIRKNVVSLLILLSAGNLAFRAEAMPLDKKCNLPRFDLKVRYDGANSNKVDFVNLQMNYWKQRNNVKQNWIEVSSCDYPIELNKECDSKFENQIKRLINWIKVFFNSNPFSRKSKKDIYNIITNFKNLRAESFSLDKEVNIKQQRCKKKKTEPSRTKPQKNETPTAQPLKNETPTALPPTLQLTTVQHQPNNLSSVNVPKILYYCFASIFEAIF